LSIYVIREILLSYFIIGRLIVIPEFIGYKDGEETSVID